MSEARRILKPQGLLFASTISRFSSFFDGVYREFFCDPAYITLVEQDLTTGQHRSKGTPYFTTAYLHHPNEIQKDITKSGLTPIALLAIEGPIWHDATVENLKKDPHAWKAMMKFLEMVESDESIIGASCHIMSISRK